MSPSRDRRDRGLCTARIGEQEGWASREVPRQKGTGHRLTDCLARGRPGSRRAHFHAAEIIVGAGLALVAVRAGEMMDQAPRKNEVRVPFEALLSQADFAGMKL